MKFDPKKWQCAKCGRIGTLCSKEVGVTVFTKVINVGATIDGESYVGTSGQVLEHGRFSGYVCCKCGMNVADSSEELIGRFKD